MAPPSTRIVARAAWPRGEDHDRRRRGTRRRFDGIRTKHDFAANNITNPVTGRNIESVTPKFGLGFRATAGFAKQGLFSLAVRLTSFGHDSFQSFSDLDGDGYGTRIHPSTDVDVGDEDVDTALSKYTISYGSLDVEMLLEIMNANGTRLELASGFRYAAVREEMDTVYTDIGIAFTTVNEEVVSAGFGLYLGALLQHALSQDFTLTVRSSVGLVSLRTDLKFQEIDDTDTEPETAADASSNSVVPFVEIGMGVQYRFSLGASSALSVGLGYELVAYTGMPGFLSFVDDVVDGKTGSSSVNVGFHGLVLRGILSW